MAKRKPKPLVRATEWVQTLMDHLAEMDRMDKRTCVAAARLLRAGCARSVTSIAGIPEWDENVAADPDLDTGEALLHLSNRLSWNADGDKHRWSLVNVYKEFP